jgi:putative ABC transport system substrate-binding protein
VVETRERRLVASLSRPGGNITGVVIVYHCPGRKAPGTAERAVPPGPPIAVLVNSTSSGTAAQLKDVQAAARTIGRKIEVLNASTGREIDSAFTTLSQLRPCGTPRYRDPFLFDRRQQIVELTARQRIAAIFEWREFHRGWWPGEAMAAASPTDIAQWASTPAEY